MNNTEWAHDSDQAAFGDSGPWVRHLPLAWRLAATPAGAASPPPDPTDAYLRALSLGSDPDSEAHAALIAYWAPLLQLCHFGLGWTRPDLGLSRWLEMGAPTDDPALEVIARWWSPQRLGDVLAWAAATDHFLDTASQMAEIGDLRNVDLTSVPDRYEHRRTAAWSAVWGGGSDPLHLGHHALVAIQASDAPPAYSGVRRTDGADPTGSGAAHRALFLPTYAGWYRTLLTQRPTAIAGRSVRTDVVCPAVGWLGQYRQSRETGLQFRGRHRWHELGN